MTFVQLQYLLELHKTRSFSKAAKNLMISQPSLSLMLKSLEEELGHPIFLRTKNGLIPTAQGADVINHAAKICESYRRMTTATPKKVSSVRISAASIAPVQRAFVRLVGENRERRDIVYSMTQESNAVCIEGLQNFSLEVGFYIVLANSHLHFLDTLQKDGLETRILATLPGAIRISKAHPLFQKEDLTPADFENEMFLDTTGASVSKALFGAGIIHIKPNHNIISSQYHVRKDLLQEGLVYDIVYFYPGYRRSDETEYRYIPITNLSYKLIAMTNPLRPLSPEVTRFLELVEEEIRTAGL